MEYEYIHANGTTAQLYEHSLSCKRDMEWVFKSDLHHWCNFDRDVLHKLALEHGYILVEKEKKVYHTIPDY